MKQPSLWHSCAATANLDLSPRPDIHTACFYPLSSEAGPYIDTPDATPPRATHETMLCNLSLIPRNNISSGEFRPRA